MTTTRDGVEPKPVTSADLAEFLDEHWCQCASLPEDAECYWHKLFDAAQAMQALEQQLSAARRESAWQSIATAPRDGSRILCVHAPYSRQFIAHFGSGANVWQDDTGALRDPTHWQWMPHGPIRQIGATSGEGAGV